MIQSGTEKSRTARSLSQFHHCHLIARFSERSEQSFEVIAVARFTFDVCDQPLGRPRGKDAWMLPLYEIGLMCVERAHHIEQRAGPIL